QIRLSLVPIIIIFRRPRLRSCLHSYTFFFCYGSRAHRDLHSFPTRRSSDLSRSRRSGSPTPTSPLLRRSRSDRHPERAGVPHRADRKSTRLNSSHVKISYAVFCLKKKKIT